MEKLMIRHVLNKLGFLRSAFAVGVGVPFLLASSAFAQDPAAVAGPAACCPSPRGGSRQPTERVIVTGSYIPTAETESALPVTVYTAEVLQNGREYAGGRSASVAFVRRNAATENDSNGGNGSAVINLRGIGQQNTLDPHQRPPCFLRSS